MSHAHAQAGRDFGRAFITGIGLNFGFALVEAGFGLRAGSLALLADAGHNFGDVLGLTLAWGADRVARRPATTRRTYGLRRSSVLAALVNAVLLLLAIGAIAWEAIRRFAHPETVAGLTVTAVAAVGVVINAATALLFLRGRRHDLNVRGAFLHMAADAGVSAAVVAAGVAIRVTGWDWLDPAASLLVVAAIAAATWGLLRESVDLALDAVPEGIDPTAVEAHLAAAPGITTVHHLHIWATSTTETALTAHLVKPDGRLDDGLLARLATELHERFGIAHATLQLEEGTGLIPLGQENAPTH